MDKTPKQCSCIICGITTTHKGIHYLHMHSSTEDKEKMSRGIQLGGIKQKAYWENYYIENPRTCLQCASIISRYKRKNKFCCRSCSAKHNNTNRQHSTLTKQKISSALKAINHKPIRKKPIIVQESYKPPFTKLYGIGKCTCCDVAFWRLTSNRKTCSPECQRKNSTYRKIIHEYEHNGEIILLESSWEVTIAKWLDIRHIDWCRPKHLVWYDMNNKLRRYFPDFYLPMYDIYLDPKNDYQISISQEKLNYFNNKIRLIYGSVEHIINEVAPIVGV